MEALKAYRSWSFLSLFIVILFWVSSVHVEYAGARNISVGGSEGWRYGYNYSDWISKAGKIYVNDVLVFKYSIPTSSSLPHNVLLLKDKSSYKKCNVSGGIKLADPTQGIGEGFAFKLKKVTNYYFACGVGNGKHCDVGLMKFGIKPVVKKGC
ncbi:hypothetical protein SUGI_0145210 [Cryptomeria japonica]|uniref:blue copper protein n=1 Tax=Cryptomeria japonica TaxID=3369 RepID=UPI002408C034|nr:blue copper protein [Cryptomeria japonica]GLJ11167.1 hypothetical protein SUGI_0145210 [Cryptomeria japonica]